MNTKVDIVSFHDLKKKFINDLTKIDHSKRHAEIFHDFVLCAACAIRNSLGWGIKELKVESLELEFTQVISKYPEGTKTKFSSLLELLVQAITVKAVPYDFLGEIYMEMELGNQYVGQYFTPSDLSSLMAQIQVNEYQTIINQKGFVSLADPCCGAGSTLLAVVRKMQLDNINFQKYLYVEGVDIDRNVALMCYLQLSLWGVPCRIYVGDSLTNVMREVWESPMYFLGFWENKINRVSIPNEV